MREFHCVNLFSLRYSFSPHNPPEAIVIYPYRLRLEFVETPWELFGDQLAKLVLYLSISFVIYTFTIIPICMYEFSFTLLHATTLNSSNRAAFAFILVHIHMGVISKAIH